MKTNRVCHCSEYSFPHRMGGGKCKCWPNVKLCSACGHPADTMTVDYGYGAYEYWGSTGVHRDIQEVTTCCEADLVPNDHRVKECLAA